jgi:putative membrane protein
MSERLHPLSGVWNTLRYGLGGGSFAFFVIMIGSTVNLVDDSLMFILFPVGFVLGVGYGITYYLVFEYELTEDTFDVTSGVFNRKHREIPYHRIQNIDIEQSFLQRLIGVGVARIETAGGGQTEAKLDFVSETEATRLQSDIRERKRTEASEGDHSTKVSPSTDETTESDSTLLFELQSSDLALLAVAFLRPGAALLIVIGIPSLPVGRDIITSILLTLAQPLGGPAELSLASLSSDEALALTIVSLPLLILCAWVVSAAYTIVMYFGFELGRIDNDLVYERGLFSRYSGTIPLEKIQTISITEPVLARPLGYAGLTVETAGYSPGQSESRDSEAAIPLTQREQTLELARAIEPFDDLSFVRSPKQARRRYAVHYLTVVVALVVIGYAVSLVYSGFSYWYAPVVLLPLVPVAAYYKWKHRGYHVGEHHIALRDGFWQRTTRVVPYYRLQTVLTQRTIFQQRLNIADLTADTASSATLLGGKAIAYDIAAEDAQRLQSLLRERLQRELRMKNR